MAPRMDDEQRHTLLVCMTTSFITTFMGSSLNLAVPDIEADLGIGASAVGWVVTSYMLVVSALNVPLGKIADARGRRRMLICGIGLFAAASFFGVFCARTWMMIACRVIQGTAGAMIFATNNAILVGAFPADQRGGVLGRNTAATYIGLSAGPVIGGLLNGSFGWRSIFMASGILSAAVFAVAASKLPDREEPEDDRRFDLRGALIYIIMMIAVIMGLTDLSIVKYSWIALAGGIALGIVFFRYESRTEAPLIRTAMFTENRPFLFSNLAALLNYGATFTVSYLLSMYLQIIKGFSSTAAGLILVAQPVMQALFSPAMGRLSDRVAPGRLASGGMGICVAGLVMLALLDTGTSLVFVISVLLLMGFGFAMFSSPNVNAIMSMARAEDHGVVNSILSTMRNLGQTMSMAVVTIIMGITMGDQALASADKAQLMGTIHITFAVFIVVCSVGIFFSLAREKGGKVRGSGRGGQ